MANQFVLPNEAWELLPKTLKDQNLIATMFPWIQGWIEAAGVDDDWPDGAYFAMHEEATEAFKEWYNNGNRMVDCDWFDIQGAYIVWSNSL